ncbi:unnamed protein product [Caenorhabditis sp. 36 PRJEB53466]|nr:unnamed protein product [Caenorhabditis sp. 36 PRJEB53466]
MGDTAVLPIRVQNVLDMEIIRLNLWSIKFNANSIVLEGFVRNEDGTMMQKVSSEAICKRMNATMLFDVSGRFFELTGQIDKEFQLKKGMPGRIAEEFMNGFPENWAFLISSCLSNEQRSAIRPIQAAPVQPLRPKEPIVTLADETDLSGDRTISRKNSDKEREDKESTRKAEIEDTEKRKLEEFQQELEQARKQKEAEKRRKEELDAANFTFRAPYSEGLGAITPIRFNRGNENTRKRGQKIFDTPSREILTSTPKTAPPREPEQPRTIDGPKKQEKLVTYATDNDLFAVPKLPRSMPAASRASSLHPHPLPTSSSSDIDVFDLADSMFETANINTTPARDSRSSKPNRRYDDYSPPNRYHGQSSSSNTFSREYDSGNRYRGRQDDYNDRISRRDATFRRNYTKRDESRMSRKRGYYNSPDEYERSNWRDNRDIRRDDYEGSDYDSKRYRPRENSSFSGRSVRMEDGYSSNKKHDDLRNQEEYERRKMDEILRKEKEIEARLRRSQKPSRRESFSSTGSLDDTVDMAAEFERENQEILDNSMLGERRPSKKRNNVKRMSAEKPKKMIAPKSRAAPQRKKKSDPIATDYLNESIASNRPKRTCATPSTPAPKRVTWARRDVDKLKLIIERNKPTGSETDWVEVHRLLAKSGVEPTDVKLTAITRLKWKEPEVRDPEVQKRNEEEEEKRRNGVKARVKQGMRMRDEMRQGGEQEAAPETAAEEVEDYDAADLSADESLLALATPIPAKRKGGTRASIMPEPVEDSPLVRENSLFANSPRLDATKAKEVETTLKYVQHLSTIQARPSSSMNKSHNKSTTRGKNTSMTVEQGAKKAMKIINGGRTIHEEDEEDDSEDDEYNSFF